MKNKKRVLFFSPSFFGYEKEIFNKLIQLDYEVDIFDERCFTKNSDKAFNKIMPYLYKNKSNLYYNQIFEKQKNKHYDYVFFIKGDTISVDLLKKFKENFNKAIFCLYLWDSIKNISNIEYKFKYFDRIFSFDSNDVSQNAKMKFRPLFYTDEYKEPFNKNVGYKYDLSFIGTIHSDRFKVIKQIISNTKNENFSIYTYKYIQSKFMFYFYYIIKKEFRSSRVIDFQFDKIKSKEITKIVSESKIILDIEHPKQIGLTMRTIEMLAMEKKIITTNSSIINYDFYKPNNVMIIDRTNPVIPKEFFSSEFEEIESSIYNKYSLESWVKDILY